jgi:hypothetical protein
MTPIDCCSLPGQHGTHAFRAAAEGISLTAFLLDLSFLFCITCGLVSLVLPCGCQSCVRFPVRNLAIRQIPAILRKFFQNGV